MSNYGHLCYKASGTNAGKLCFKASGSGAGSLIFKAKDTIGGKCEIRIPWSPQSYVCNTYHAYHEVVCTSTCTFTSGTGSYTTNHTASELVFSVTITSAPAVFRISLFYSIHCAANEGTNVTCQYFTSQQGSTPQFGLTSIPASPNNRRLSFSFDKNKILSEVSIN